MTTDFERRVAPNDCELRAVGNRLIGFIPYGRWSEKMGAFRERIMPGAFARSLADYPDVPLLLEHEPPAIARAPVTMKLRDARDGLHIEAKLDMEDTDAKRIRTKIARRDVKGLSFQMLVKRPGGDKWSADGAERDIIEARLIEISPVTFPAYPSTDVALRSLSEWRKQNSVVVPAWLAAAQARERHLFLLTRR